MSSTYDERLAIRNASTLAQAQSSFDNMAEPEPTEREILINDIRQAGALCIEYIGRAERAAERGDEDAARDYLRSATAELQVEASAEMGD